MPRPKALVPKLCIDKSRNRAFCKVNGRFIVLGPAGSADSQLAYANVLKALEQNRSLDAVVIAAKCRLGIPKDRIPIPLSDLFLRFATEELSRYSKAEQFCLKGAIKIARELFGDTPTADFGPLRLRTVRDAMIRKGWSRSFINKEIKRLRLIFRWGVSWELVSQTVVDSLSTVKSLSVGDSDAPESRARRAVPVADLEAVRAVLSPKNRDIYDLMLLTGCRPGELLSLTTGMIDRSVDVWRAELKSHKTAHQGKSRTLYFNATAQAILLRHLKADPDELIFAIKRNSFGNAVKRACDEAGVPKFTPHWLRHTVATKLADELGTESAQRLLGHSTTAMTLHYSRAAEKQAIEAVRKLG